MQTHLCISVGCRGEIENVGVVYDVKSMVEETYAEFVGRFDEDSEEDREGWKSYVDEFGFKDEYEWGWCLGLGEEDGEYYIDMLNPNFIEWENMVRAKFESDEFEWNEVASEDLYDLIDLFM